MTPCSHVFPDSLHGDAPMQPRKEMWQSHRDWGTAGRESDCAPYCGMSRSPAPSLLTLSPQLRLHLSWSVLLSACLSCRRSLLYTKACWETFYVLNQHGTQVQVCRGHCLTFLGHSISSAVTSSWGVWANFQGGDCSMLYVQPPSALIMMLKHSIGKASSIRNSNVTSQGMSTIKLSMNELQELLDC